LRREGEEREERERGELEEEGGTAHGWAEYNSIQTAPTQEISCEGVTNI
jgi:hypothetical protein